MIPVLMYHEVVKRDDRQNKNMHQSYYLNIEDFIDQMKAIVRRKIASVSLDQLFDDNNLTRKIAITFDDGHIGNYLFVLPVLRELKLIANFFVTTGWIGKEGMLSWDLLRVLVKEGMHVYSHAASHRPLSTLSSEEIENELRYSRQILEKNLGIRVRFLSLPHGDYDWRVKKIAKEVGYDGIFSSEPEYINSTQKELIFGRFPIKKTDGIDVFTSIIEGNNPDQRFVRYLNRLKSLIRYCLGVNNYRRIYRLINRIEERSGK